MKYTLDESQSRAVDTIIASKYKLNLLIGRAGYGKTFTAKEIVTRAIEDGTSPEDIYFCAPTGKAAKVLQDDLELLELPNKAMTIHRMLGCMGNDWQYGRNNRLMGSLFFVDESSMIDVNLFNRLLYSVDDKAKMIFIGDPAQLFPVGPGAPFADIVRARPTGRVSELEICHRQQDGSLIANACESVRQGKRILYGKAGEHTLDGGLEDDLFLVETHDHEDLLGRLSDIVRPWFEGCKDWICLAPQHRGEVGITEINKYLQAELNGNEQRRITVTDNKVFRLGDRVRQTKNNYSLGVFNGYIGTITAIKGNELTVDYQGTEVKYPDKKAMFDLELGYCVSIHSSQGSGYKYGVIVADSSHTFMWNRQLIYVSMSRFKRQCYVLGQRQTVARAIAKDVRNRRQTYLSEALGNG